MENWEIFLLIKPLGVFAFMVLIVLPIEWAILKVIPDGRFKALLRKRIN